MNIKPKGTGIYLTPEFYNSNAWRHAGLYGQRLFLDLHNGINWTGKGKKQEFTNHAELSFTQDDFMEKYGCCKATYTAARDNLIYTGLIRMTHKGGNGRGDFSKYKLCYLGGKPLPNNDQQRWMLFDGEKKNWGHEIPKSPHRIGIKNRFEKGVGGKKPTLSKPPLNGGIPLSQ